MTRADLEPIASSEDQPIEWFARTASRWAVRCHCAATWRAGAGYLIAPWRVEVTPGHMREVTTADCPAAVHYDPDDPGNQDAECDCPRIECEPYFLDCDPDHPDAIALWRCEPRPAPVWLLRLRRWQCQIGAKRRGRPVLWGARVQREATWVDRVLFGGGGRFGLLVGDRQQRLGEAEWRHCAICAAITRHVARNGGGEVCTRRHRCDGYLPIGRGGRR